MPTAPLWCLILITLKRSSNIKDQGITTQPRCVNLSQAWTAIQPSSLTHRYGLLQTIKTLLYIHQKEYIVIKGMPLSPQSTEQSCDTNSSKNTRWILILQRERMSPIKKSKARFYRKNVWIKLDMRGCRLSTCSCDISCMIFCLDFIIY